MIEDYLPFKLVICSNFATGSVVVCFLGMKSEFRWGGTAGCYHAACMSPGGVGLGEALRLPSASSHHLIE